MGAVHHAAERGGAGCTDGDHENRDEVACIPERRGRQGNLEQGTTRRSTHVDVAGTERGAGVGGVTAGYGDF